MRKEQLLFETEIFCNIINVFTVINLMRSCRIKVFSFFFFFTWPKILTLSGLLTHYTQKQWPANKVCVFVWVSIWVHSAWACTKIIPPVSRWMVLLLNWWSIGQTPAVISHMLTTPLTVPQHLPPLRCVTFSSPASSDSWPLFVANHVVGSVMNIKL